MIRKKVGKYVYYVCASNKTGNVCSSHSFRQIELESIILEAIRVQITILLDIQKCLEHLCFLSDSDNIQKINERIMQRKAEIDQYEQYKCLLYEDYVNRDISEDDYDMFETQYTERIEKLNQSLVILRKESESHKADSLPHAEHFGWNINKIELSRQLAAHLLERVDVFEGKRIIIQFRFRDGFGLINIDTTAHSNDAELRRT